MSVSKPSRVHQLQKDVRSASHLLEENTTSTHHSNAEMESMRLHNCCAVMIHVHLLALGFREMLPSCSSAFHILYMPLDQILNIKRARASARELTSQQDSALVVALHC